MSQPPDTEPAPVTTRRSDTEFAHGDVGFRPPEALMSGIVLGFVGLGLALLIAANIDVEWTWVYWGQHRVGEDGTTEITFDRSTIFRNFGLAALAAIGLVLAVWRSWLAYKQTQIGLKQNETANKQTTIAHKGLQIERFQKALEMIGRGNDIQVKLAGLRILETLANEDPKILLEQVSYCLMDYVRERTKENNDAFFNLNTERRFRNHKAKLEPPETTSADVELALNALFRLRTKLDHLQTAEVPIQYDLSDTSFEYVTLTGYDLSQIEFRHCWHSLFGITQCDLTESTLENFFGQGEVGSGCDLSGASISLNDHWEINECYFNPDNPPIELTVKRPKGLVAPADRYIFHEKKWPIVLPPDFTGNDTEKEAYFRTALELLDWGDLETDLVALMAGHPYCNTPFKPDIAANHGEKPELKRGTI
ncbi:hypothetical protein DYI23_05895 [Roseibium polysiphoniae]|uniref:Pentapeptide repeat protein n=1 Tax=Roseibium polysiphoniae TaxID=2571221 RepID=A0A944GSL4_9HYPH|nr:hypothetical protein [Roseibium polysiphoniae]MBS8259746.1 hypothetical protein [Roseibium polysiphoniae]